ncbi:MAG TPA: TonB-dependent receptor plug domain-containing protein, partial [Chitinophagaceae bacterium]
MNNQSGFINKLRRPVQLSLLMLLVCLNAFSQQAPSVHGTVTGTDNKPVPGITVIVKGTQTGAITGPDGRYAIKANKGDILVFRSIGFDTREVAVGASSLINVQLSSMNKGLNEIVVLGYGSQKKKDLTAAVSTIDVSKLKDIPVANVSRLLEGQAPGVTVKQATGAPGREFEVVIRGMGSLGAGSAPLYVIDGFPVGTSIGQNLNPDDIASITILKDAVSTAIYGARGANGVVLITTKNARAGEVNLSVTADYGVQNIPESRKTKVLNGKDFAQFKKDIFMDKIRYFQQREPSIDEVPLNYRYPEQTKYSTNWFDAILHQNAPYQNYDVTLSSGKGPIRSLVSAGFLNQEGTLINTNYKLYSVRANITGAVNDFISMGVNIDGSYSTQHVASTEGRAELVGSTLLMDPR